MLLTLSPVVPGSWRLCRRSPRCQSWKRSQSLRISCTLAGRFLYNKAAPKPCRTAKAPAAPSLQLHVTRGPAAGRSRRCATAPTNFQTSEHFPNAIAWARSTRVANNIIGSACFPFALTADHFFLLNLQQQGMQYEEQ